MHQERCVIEGGAKVSQFDAFIGAPSDEHRFVQSNHVWKNKNRNDYFISEHSSPACTILDLVGHVRFSGCNISLMSSTPCVSPRNHAHRQKDALALPEISSSSSTKSAHSTRLNSRRHTSHWTPFGSWSVAIPLLLVHFLSLSVVNAQQRNRTDIVVFSNFCDCTLGCDDPPEPDCAPDISIIANDDEEGAFECDDDLQDCTWADVRGSFSVCLFNIGLTLLISCTV